MIPVRNGIIHEIKCLVKFFRFYFCFVSLDFRRSSCTIKLITVYVMYLIGSSSNKTQNDLYTTQLHLSPPPVFHSDSITYPTALG